MGRIARLSRLLLLLSLPAVLSAATLPELFRKAKDEIKLGSYDSALSTLGEVETASQQPGLEKDREALRPSLAFYKGVCHAALGKAEEARSEFTEYLTASPNATLDPAIYPKRVVTAFEEARKASAPATGSGEGAGMGITAAYRSFKKPDGAARAPEGDDWASGPVRILLTPSEADEFRHLADPASRSEFIIKFWKVRDPKPETPENEFRDEFEKRAAFADQYFVQGEKRGSSTDRGTVFILLGPPPRSSQRPMQTGDDSADPAALSLYTPGVQQEAALGGKQNGSRSQQVARIDATTGVGTSVNAPSANWREVWRYYRKDLPGRLPYEYVDFQFITKPGYGENVLQREPAILDALERAKSALPKP